MKKLYIGIIITCLCFLSSCSNKEYETLQVEDTKFMVTRNMVSNNTYMGTDYIYIYSDDSCGSYDSTTCAILKKDDSFWEGRAQNKEREEQFLSTLNINELKETNGTFKSGKYTLFRIENDAYWVFFYENYLLVRKDNKDICFSYTVELRKSVLDFYKHYCPSCVIL